MKWLNKIWGLFIFLSNAKAVWIILIDHQCTKCFGDVSNSITVTRFRTQKTIDWLKPKLDLIVSQQRRGLNSTPECRTCDSFQVTLLVLTQYNTKMPLQGKIHSLPVFTLWYWYTFYTGLFSSYLNKFFCRVFVSTASYTFWVACPTLTGTVIHACCLNYESNVRENHKEHWWWQWFKHIVYSLVSARHKAVTHLICGKNHDEHATTVSHHIYITEKGR